MLKHTIHNNNISKHHHLIFTYFEKLHTVPNHIIWFREKQKWILPTSLLFSMQNDEERTKKTFLEELQREAANMYTHFALVVVVVHILIFPAPHPEFKAYGEMLCQQKWAIFQQNFSIEHKRPLAAFENE